jgi:MoaE-MoaD fusion protein
MHLSIKLFAVARQRAGADEIAVELPEGATVRDLRHALVEQHPPLADVLRHARLAVDNEYAGDAAVIPAGAEVAIIPPVSGG